MYVYPYLIYFETRKFRSIAGSNFLKFNLSVFKNEQIASFLPSLTIIDVVYTHMDIRIGYVWILENLCLLLIPIF